MLTHAVIPVDLEMLVPENDARPDCLRIRSSCSRQLIDVAKSMHSRS